MTVLTKCRDERQCNFCASTIKSGDMYLNQRAYRGGGTSTCFKCLWLQVLTVRLEIDRIGN